MHWLHTDYNPNSSSVTASRVLESVKEPLESRVWFAYPNQSANVFGNSLGVGTTDQPSNIVRAACDGTGAVQDWQYQYDYYGHVTQSVDPVGRTLAMTYDPTNHVDLLSVTNTSPAYPDPILQLANYVRHRPQQITGASLRSTYLTYNAVGQTLTSTTPDDATWTNSYAPASTMILPAGCTGPANCGFLMKEVGPSVAVPASQGGGVQTPIYSFTYDGVGRVQTTLGPDQELLTYSYDAADRLTETLFPDDTSETRSYLAPGPSGQPPQVLLDLTSFTDRLGNTITRTYDGFRQLVEIDEPAGRATKLIYSPDGQVQSITDPRNQVTTYNRDLEGRLTSISYPTPRPNSTPTISSGGSRPSRPTPRRRCRARSGTHTT